LHFLLKFLFSRHSRSRNRLLSHLVSPLVAFASYRERRLNGRSVAGGLFGASLQRYIRSRQVAGERGHERSRSLEYITQYEYPRTERSNNNGILVRAPSKYARRASFYMSIDVLAKQRTSICLCSSSAGDGEDDDDGDEEEDATRNANVHRPRRDIGVESSTTECNEPPTLPPSPLSSTAMTATALALFYSRATPLAHLLREFLAFAIGRRTIASSRSNASRWERSPVSPGDAFYSSFDRCDRRPGAAHHCPQGHWRTTANLVCAF